MSTGLSLESAQTIVAAAIAKARELKLKPVAAAVYDARGALKAFAAEDGTSLARAQVASAKATGVLGMGIGSRALVKRATEAPQFVAAVSTVIPGGLVPVPGGALIRSPHGELIGAIGVSGDTSENDESAAIAGVEAAGFTPEP